MFSQQCDVTLGDSPGDLFGEIEEHVHVKVQTMDRVFHYCLFFICGGIEYAECTCRCDQTVNACKLQLLHR